MMNVSGSTTIVGILGYPVKHTLSPAMHNAAFAALRLDFIYLPFEVHPGNLREAVRSLKALTIRGVNITIPHKENVLAFLDAVDPLAGRIGSVNTVVNRNGTLAGYNTDADGFLRDLRSKRCDPNGKRILLFGAGGAGRSIAHALSKAGARAVVITDRDERRSRALAAATGKGKHLPFAAWKGALGKSDILVNATPLGMHREDPSPATAAELKSLRFVYDVIYHRETALLAAARKAGIPRAGGRGMLLHQGALAFELWTGRKAPLRVMERALTTSLAKSR